MKRDLDRLANRTFDILIIGGGITGACIARDAARRGLKVALVEKNDFAHATSAHNSKLIHGGLRYLRNFELGLVRESLRERRIWQRTAPHLVHPLPFLVPLYGGGFKARATLAAGLSLYDMLSFDRGWLDDPAQRLPGHRWFNKTDAVAHEPALAGENLEGAFQYYDAQMYSPERLALENILDAVGHGATIANHLRVDGLLLRHGRVEGASVRDEMGNAVFDVRAKLTIVAAGPWSDIFLTQVLSKPASHKLMRSKGIHLIVPAMTKDSALTVAAQGGHFFVLPWRGHSLLGTTDTAYPGAPDAVSVSEADIEGFLKFINDNLPSATLTRDKVEHFYAGLRPLVDDGSGDTYDASRRAEIVDHGKDDGVGNLYSAVGGKWTTSRDLAETVVDTLVSRLETKASPCDTATALLPGGMKQFSEFEKALTQESDNFSGIDHLARLYGARLPEVLALTLKQPELRSTFSPSGDIGAQILFAMREEMALTLEDVVIRRTGIGQLGKPEDSVLERAAKIMANELHWSEDRRKGEITAIARHYKTHGDAA